VVEDDRMRILILDALEAKYEGQVQEARCNIEVYLNNPVGIGEHSDLVQAIDEQVSAMVEAQEKKEALVWFD
jgi:hypothetical protein